MHRDDRAKMNKTSNLHIIKICKVCTMCKAYVKVRKISAFLQGLVTLLTTVSIYYCGHSVSTNSLSSTRCRSHCPMSQHLTTVAIAQQKCLCHLMSVHLLV